MDQLTSCQTSIERALELLNDPELTYPARNRLQRAVLACVRYAAREAGLLEPEFPGRYELPSSSAQPLRDICEVANSLLDRIQAICQPSEPLDERWAQGRLEVLRGLERLRRLLGPPNQSSS